jgi:hypothetical protein
MMEEQIRSAEVRAQFVAMLPALSHKLYCGAVLHAFVCATFSNKIMPLLSRTMALVVGSAGVAGGFPTL